MSWLEIVLVKEGDINGSMDGHSRGRQKAGERVRGKARSMESITPQASATEC